MSKPNHKQSSSVRCKIDRIIQLNKDVRQVFLKLPSGTVVDYQPGQYAEIILEKNGSSSFSIANVANKIQEIELHIRYLPDGGSCDEVSALLDQRADLEVIFPNGQCTLKAENKNKLIFLAGSTGFAPMKAMLEHSFQTGRQQEIFLYWGGVELQDIYLHELVKQWDQKYSNFHYIPALSEPDKEPGWNGRTGFIHKCVLQDFPDLSSGIEIYAGGSPGMVYAALDDFEKQGLNEKNIYSDVFSYAPRPGKKIPEQV